MNDKLFRQQYMLRMPPRDPLFERAKAAWLRYFRETEAFESTICSAVNDRGKAHPNTPEEQYRCLQYALTMRKLHLDPLKPAIPRDMWQAANDAAWREFDEFG